MVSNDPEDIYEHAQVCFIRVIAKVDPCPTIKVGLCEMCYVSGCKRDFIGVNVYLGCALLSLLCSLSLLPQVLKPAVLNLWMTDVIGG